jgi:hypothetical protein
LRVRSVGLESDLLLEKNYYKAGAQGAEWVASPPVFQGISVKTDRSDKADKADNTEKTNPVVLKNGRVCAVLPN